MKIRYFLATVLFASLFIYGAVKLMVAMVDRFEFPVEITLLPRDTTAAPVVVAQDLAPLSEPESATEPEPVPEAEPEPEPVVVKPEPIAEPATSVVTTNLEALGKTTPTQWGEHTSGIVNRVKTNSAEGTRTLFLTINAYANNIPEISETLAANNIKATFFVSGYFMRRNAEIVKLWASNPLFSIQNMGNRCRPLSTQGKSAYEVEGTANIQDALDEVKKGADAIAAVTGKRPNLYRSATGYTDEVAVAAVNTMGTKVIGYEKVTDGGGVIAAEDIKNNIINAGNGNILVISINPSHPNILKGLQDAISEIKAKNLPVKFEKLSDYENAFETIR